MFKKVTLVQVSLVVLLITMSTNVHTIQAHTILEKTELEVLEKTEAEVHSFSKTDEIILAAGITSGITMFIPKLYKPYKLNMLFGNKQASPITFYLGAAGVIATGITAVIKDFEKTKKITEQKK